jgi:hypothetical protein
VAKFDYGEVLFVTAKHVVEALIVNPKIRAFILLPDASVAEGGQSLLLVPIHELAAHESHNDIALLVANTKLEYGSGEKLCKIHVLRAAFDVPEIGQPCLALGYPQPPGSNDYQLQASQGVIEEIHPKRRDNTFSTFPSFRTTAFYSPGMSGGPIIDTEGRAIGVISHGNDAKEPENVVGYGACLGAILEMSLTLHDVAGVEHDLSVVQLADMGYIGDKKDSAITLVRTDDDGLILSWSNTKEDPGHYVP